MNIPFLRLEELHKPLENEFIGVFSDCVKTNQFILGSNVTKFEDEFAAFSGTKYAVGVASGVDALKISLLSLGITKGDEVIVPAHTFIATWFAVSEIGAIPIPVDVNENTMNIDFTLLESHISAKTKAIVAVHLYGLMADMNEIITIAEKYDLFIVEDFAQAHGSVYHGKTAGSIGNINGTSFYPSKNLGAFGDGGMITTNDSFLAEKARAYRNNGSVEKYVHTILGFNSRLDNIQAGLLSLKLKHLNSWNSERVRLAKYYISKLEKNEYISFQEVTPEKLHTYHLFVVKCERRDELVQFLAENGVSTSIHYPIPPHLQEAYSSMNTQSYPICENLSRKILSLPLYPHLSTIEIDYICELINQFYENRLMQ